MDYFHPNADCYYAEIVVDDYVVEHDGVAIVDEVDPSAEMLHEMVSSEDEKQHVHRMLKLVVVPTVVVKHCVNLDVDDYGEIVRDYSLVDLEVVH